MLRFTSAITTGVGILFAVPALTGGDRVASLEDALARTIASLETFTSVAERLESDETEAVRALQLFTEEPIEDERERDERVFELRQEVNALQIRLDAAEGGVPVERVLAGSAAPDALVLPPLAAEGSPPDNLAGDTGAGAPGAAPRPTGGLDAATRALLEEIRAPGLAPAGSDPAASPGPEVPAAPVETEGYSADPLRQARACLRAGRHEKGLALLEPLDATAEVRFWRARLLEELGRVDEAVDAFDAALRAAPEGPIAERAAERLEFLTWKRDFVRSLPGGERAAPTEEVRRP